MPRSESKEATKSSSKPTKSLTDLPNEIIGQIFGYLFEDQAFFGLERRLTCDPSRQMRGDFTGGRTNITTGDRKKGLSLYAMNPIQNKESIETIDIRFCQINTRLREVALERLFNHTRFMITPEVWGFKKWQPGKNYLSKMDEAVGGLALAHIRNMTIQIELHFGFDRLRRFDGVVDPCEWLTHGAKSDILMLGRLFKQVFERRHQIDLTSGTTSFIPDKSISRCHIATCLDESYHDPLRGWVTCVPYINIRVSGLATRRVGIVFSFSPIRHGRYDRRAWDAFKVQFAHDLLSGWLDKHVFEPFATKYGWKLDGGFENA